MDVCASQKPIGHAIDANILGGLRQLGEENLEIERGTFFAIEAKHLTIAVGLGAARLIDGASLFVENDALVAAEPEVGHNIGRHAKIAMQHGLVVFLCQHPCNGTIGTVFGKTFILWEECPDVVGHRGDILDEPHVLVPRVVLGFGPSNGGLMVFSIYGGFRIGRQEHIMELCQDLDF